MNNTAEKWLFGFSKVKWLQYKVRWAYVQAIDVKVSEDLTLQKSLKSVNFWQSYLKNKKVDVFLGHRVVQTVKSTFSYKVKSTFAQPKNITRW